MKKLALKPVGSLASKPGPTRSKEGWQSSNTARDPLMTDGEIGVDHSEQRWRNEEINLLTEPNRKSVNRKFIDRKSDNGRND